MEILKSGIEKNELLYWNSEPLESEAMVEDIDHFDARGMMRVYGRSDHFHRYRSFNMDIWKNKQGRLFMRLWSRCRDVAWQSFEFKGFDVTMIPEKNRDHGFEDYWIPKVVRDVYMNWISEE